jgi:hypothetical protein
MCSDIPFHVIESMNEAAKQFLIDTEPSSEKFLLLDSLSWLMIECYEAPTGSDLAHQACLD